MHGVSLLPNAFARIAVAVAGPLLLLLLLVATRMDAVVAASTSATPFPLPAPSTAAAMPAHYRLLYSEEFVDWGTAADHETAAARFAADWRVIDAGTQDAPSDWRVDADAHWLIQRSNIHGGDRFYAAVPKPGTHALYAPDARVVNGSAQPQRWPLDEYVLRVRIRTPSKNVDADTIGVLFNYRDERNFDRVVWRDGGRFYWQYRRVERQRGGVWRVLQQECPQPPLFGSDPGVCAPEYPGMLLMTWEIQVSHGGRRIRVWIDNCLEFDVPPAATEAEHDGVGRSFALYTYGNRQVVFDSVHLYGPPVKCAAGYALSDDLRRCEDMNECAAAAADASDRPPCGANMRCVNTPGGHACRCISDGYVRSSDGAECVDRDECADGSAQCEHVCMNIDGTYACACRPGYRLGADGRSCHDIDECELANGGCTQQCVNLVGGYACRCHNASYVLADDGRHCIDALAAAAASGAYGQRQNRSDNGASIRDHDSQMVHACHGFCQTISDDGTACVVSAPAVVAFVAVCVAGVSAFGHGAASGYALWQRRQRQQRQLLLREQARRAGAGAPAATREASGQARANAAHGQPRGGASTAGEAASSVRHRRAQL